MIRLNDQLYWIEDTCSCYVVTAGDKALMIDCGTNFLPARLGTIGVRQVECWLLTHFHRDQCGAATQWQKQGVQVAIPFTEKRFLEEPDLLRASYDIFDNYTSYYPGFTSVDDIRPDLYAKDYERIPWRNLRFEVVPLPGHTFGSVGFLFELGGKRILACGDLMSQPSQMTNYFSSQWSYMDFKGHSNLLESLKLVASLKLDLVLPGHGAPFEPDSLAMDKLRKNLERLFELFYARPYQYYQPQFRKITPHVYEVTNSGATTYIVQDDHGHALFIDCGYTATSPINSNPHRFIDNLTPYLAEKLGINEVEWFLPTHYHDDHLAGYPALKARYGTQVVSSPELREILEHPELYDMPCSVPEGMKVDRIVNRGEAFQWRGVDFFVEQHPGQTLYHHLIWFVVDQKKYLCIGDNIAGMSFSESRDYVHSFIPKNRTPVSSYADMPRQILDHSPNFLLTGHGGAVDFDKEKAQRWRNWMGEWQELFTEVLDQPHPNFGMDPRWVEFHPYKVRIQPGAVVSFKVIVTNHETDRRRCKLTFRSLEDVKLDPLEMELEIEGRGTAFCELIARFPDRFTTHSLPLVANVTWNGHNLGEIAEAVAYW